MQQGAFRDKFGEDRWRERGRVVAATVRKAATGLVGTPVASSHTQRRGQGLLERRWS